MVETDIKSRIEYIQRRLLELGYFGVGEIDGQLDEKTKDSILIFRRRNNLPLSTEVDDAFMSALETGQPRAVPVAQATATAKDIAPKVEAVAAATEAKNASWWNRFIAWLLGIPSLLSTLVLLLVQQFDSVIPIVTSIRGVFAEIPFQFYLGGFALLCIVFAIQSHKAVKTAEKAEDSLVAGYQIGTVKNDAPAMQEDVVK